MKKNYNSPKVTISVVSVAQMIASSPAGISVKNGSTKASSSCEVLSNERNGYEDDEQKGWSDGLW